MAGGADFIVICATNKIMCAKHCICYITCVDEMVLDFIRQDCLTKNHYNHCNSIIKMS